VIDIFARRTVRWRVSSSLWTDFLLDALEQAIYDRCGKDIRGLVHHSDPVSLMRYTERLADVGTEPSVGSRGDSRPLARLSRHDRREEPPIFPRCQGSMQAEQGGGFENDRGSDQPARPHQQRTHAGEQSIRKTEIV
jgi:hypothetical protein